MNYYCTYFDRNYLTRGIALYKSLVKFKGNDFRFLIMCMDDESYFALRSAQFAGVELIKLADLERYDHLFGSTKPKRSTFEHYAACKPSLILYIFEKNTEIDTVTYLDSDLYFFGNPEIIEKDLSDFSVALTPHRYQFNREKLIGKGLFNAGWLSFSREKEGLACLKWWRTQCMDWCRDIEEIERYADQKYLNRLPELFGGVKIIDHLGANLGPWNVRGYSIGVGSSGPLVDKVNIVFYHFHGLRKVGKFIFDSGLSNYGVVLSNGLRDIIYKPYLMALRDAEQQFPGFQIRALVRHPEENRQWLSSSSHSLLRIAKRLIFMSYIVFR